MAAVKKPTALEVRIPLEERAAVVIRFAGDSGDGMQLAGTQFTHTSAILGNDISTLPDFPPRSAPPPGLAGVSGFQVHFCSPRHPHPRRRARRPGGDEPRRPEDQPQGPGDGRHPHRQPRRLRARRPAQGRLRRQPARGRLAGKATASSPSPITTLNREAVPA